MLCDGLEAGFFGLFELVELLKGSEAGLLSERVVVSACELIENFVDALNDLLF